MFTLNRGTGLAALPFSKHLLSSCSNPLPSLKMEEQQGSKIGDDMIWLGLPYNDRHVVNYILYFGCGMVVRLDISFGNNIHWS